MDEQARGSVVVSGAGSGDGDTIDTWWANFRRLAPMTRAFNHAIAGPHFEERFKRWPRPPHDPDATINDLIFARMIDPEWSSLHRAFVDKETAKIEARRLAPGLRVPETLSVVAMDNVRSVEHLYERLRAFIGRDAIAKPTHASGAATFLRDLASPDDIGLLYRIASVDYAYVMREMQYRRLPRKVIVEAVVPAPGASPPDDYKFHCVHGEPLLCQIDQGRFGRARSRLLRVPDFTPMDADDGLEQPATCDFPDPTRIAAMIAAARALAAPFDFVRVDLYNGVDGIYFGELTFTPSASLGVAPCAEGDHFENDTHRRYSRIIMDAVRRA